MKCSSLVRVSLLVFLGVMLSNGLVHAQSINIDYGNGAGTASDSYAGAGMTGVWNALSGPTGVPEALFDLGATPIPATVTLTGGAGGAPTMFDHPATSGAVEELLDDYTSGGTDATGSILFSGLENGVYQVIVYAWTPGDPDVFTAVWEDCSDITSHLIGGTWPGQIEDGITQARFLKTVVDGTMEICTAGGLTWEGAINGIQLVALDCVGAPGGICDLPADVGPCDEVVPRFFYNACTNQCELFDWGGCDGNANNFVTLEECAAACPSGVDIPAISDWGLALTALTLAAGATIVLTRRRSPRIA